jgi:metallo-beta-lactamase family protein
MKIRFLGGADTVTGSTHLIEANGHRLLRDCGLYQGRRNIARKINREVLFDPATVDAMVLSHAHVDHCGNIPTLVKHAYQGPIHASRATCKLCEIMLLDAAKIQEQDADYLNQKTSRKGLEPVEPLYTTEDALNALRLFQSHGYHQSLDLLPGIRMDSLEAGHVLGSELSVFTVEEHGRTARIGYAVDLGRHHLPILRDPENMERIDVLVIESTYGNRYHDNIENAGAKLAEIIRRTVQRGGRVLIPSFALERTQELLYHLASLYRTQALEPVPVYVDSPMATAVTRVFAQNTEYMDEAFGDLREVGRVFEAPWVHFVESVKESKELTASRKPCIVISASGMCEHGRILHHLKAHISNPANTVVIVGFQAEHTLGRRLVEKQDVVRIFGEQYERRADVKVINAFSAHADRNDLLNYIRHLRPPQTFLVHGEEEPRQALAHTIREEGLSEVHLPARGDAVEI